MTEPTRKRIQTSDTGRRSLTKEGKRVVAEAAVAMAKREPTRGVRPARVQGRLLDMVRRAIPRRTAEPNIVLTTDELMTLTQAAALLSDLESEHSERVRLERENVKLTLLSDQLRGIADAAVDVLWNAKQTDDPATEEVPATLTRKLMDRAGPWLESQDWRDMAEAQVGVEEET